MIHQTGFEFESVSYHRETELHRFEYDPETTSASMAVVAALSEMRGVEPTAFEPLQHSVNSDALDTLVADGTGGPIQIAFHHEGYAITADGRGIVTVGPGDDDTQSEGVSS